MGESGDGGMVGPGRGLRNIDGIRDLPLAVEGDGDALRCGEGGRCEEANQNHGQ
jgi:hypothetical protein